MPYLFIIASGSMAPLLFSGYPFWFNSLSLFLLTLALVVFRPTRWVAFFFLASSWTLWNVEQRLQSRVASLTEARSYKGQIVGIPVRHDDVLEFRFQPASADGIWLVRWYNPGQEVISGDYWQLPLKVRPPRGRLNFSGPDREQWYFTNEISGLGTVSKGLPVRLSSSHTFGVDYLRWTIREEFIRQLGAHQGAAVILALSIADRSLMAENLNRALRETGTGHLVAVSGLHTGLVALFCYWLGRLLSVTLVRWRPGFCALNTSWWFAITGALGYAMLAGFETSVLRAWIMLLVLAGYRLLHRQPPIVRAWLMALVAVLILQPVSPLGAGFWLSFAAVGALLWTFSPRRPAVGSVTALVIAQGGIFLCMVGFGFFWFQQVSISGLIVNLLAIPWVSLITLPLTLLSLLLQLAGGPAQEMVTLMAAASAQILIDGLIFAQARMGYAVLRFNENGVYGLVLMTLGGVILLLPGGIKWRWLGLIAFLPLIVNQPRKPAAGTIDVDFLDVGQGLAVLVKTRNHLLLYDTGPGQPGQWDLYQGTIQPAMGGRLPDRVIVSHGDLDHAGGLRSVQEAVPARDIMINRSGSGRQYGCYRGIAWLWDKVEFDVLHPGFYLPYSGNNSSCVLSIVTANGSLLLPGDIESGIERSLLQSELKPHRVLLAGHHGSKTSSTSQWLNTLKPEVVIFSTGKFNRFGHPHPRVLERVGRLTLKAWSTGDCGAIRMQLGYPGEIQLMSARKARPAPWRQPAAENCP